MIHYVLLTVFIIVAVLDLGLGDSSITGMSFAAILMFGAWLWWIFSKVANFTFFTEIFWFFYSACILLIVFSIIHYMMVTLVPYGYIFFSTISLLVIFNMWRNAQAIKKEKERRECRRIHIEEWEEEIKRKKDEEEKNYKPFSTTDNVVLGILFIGISAIVKYAESNSKLKKRK